LLKLSVEKHTTHLTPNALFITANSTSVAKNIQLHEERIKELRVTDGFRSGSARETTGTLHRLGNTVTRNNHCTGIPEYFAAP